VRERDNVARQRDAHRRKVLATQAINDPLDSAAKAAVEVARGPGAINNRQQIPGIEDPWTPELKRHLANNVAGGVEDPGDRIVVSEVEDVAPRE
jgi:hypothetical protein